MLFAQIRSDNLVPLNSSVKQDIIISLIRLEISSKLKRKKGTELIFTNYFIFVFLSFYIYIYIYCYYVFLLLFSTRNAQVLVHVRICPNQLISEGRTSTTSLCYY